MENMKVPLSIAWLSENGLLKRAAEVRGETVVNTESLSTGCYFMTPNGLQHSQWDDHMLFTIGQLIKLGFDLGILDYCVCSKLKADCNREQALLAAMQQEYED